MINVHRRMPLECPHSQLFTSEPIRDIGPTNNEMPSRQLITLSPDQTKIAFQVRRALPSENRYCIGMVVAPIDGGKPRLVDQGGDAIFYDPTMNGGMGLPSGIPMPITPRWSEDGSTIYFIKRVKEKIALWKAKTDGSESEIAVQDISDIVDFRILNTQSAVIRLSSATTLNSQDKTERLTGYHFDERFVPMASDKPILYRPVSQQFRIANLTTGEISAASEDDISRSGIEQSRFISNLFSATGSVAEMGSIDELVPPSRYLAATMNGQRFTCAKDSCTNVLGPIWWDKSGTRVRFIARGGWAQQETSVYEWRPTSDKVRRVYSTSDLLLDCQPLGEDQLICLRETSIRPRHIVKIKLPLGKVEPVLDLNPEFHALRLGSTRRINITTEAGASAFADLVLPTDWRRGTPSPLIVVQYRSRGFLRGGIGDEFPIQLFANNGYAVLSVNRPVPVGYQARPKDYIEVDRLGLLDFADRRNVLSAIEKAVRKTIADGIADPSRIGITGLSDGSSTVQFAALNSELFSAGIASGCCWERNQTALLGPYPAKQYKRIGWPLISNPDEEFWSHISLAQNAERVRFPLLFSMPDEEFRSALESYTALKEVGKPVDMFVFNDEHHVKRQPAHRLAAYVRSLDWFNFWLRDVWPDDERRKKEVSRWSQMKDTTQASQPSRRLTATGDPTASPSLGIEQ